MFEKEGLLERAGKLGGQLLAAFRALQQDCRVVGDVQGLGAMVGVELVKDREAKIPAPEHTDFVLRRAAERGVLLLRAGVYRNVIRILAPLVIGEEDLGRALSVLADCVREAEALPVA